MNVSGGTIARVSGTGGGSTVTISGGVCGGEFDAASGRVINVSGGAIVGSRFNALDGSAVHILDRGVTLSGVLADASFFDFDLDGFSSFRRDAFSPLAILTVTLVPTPGVASGLVLAGLVGVGRRRP